MNADPFLALWSAVCLQAIYEATYHNPHRLSARMFVESRTFELICELIGWNCAEIRSKLDTPGLHDSFRKLRRTGRYAR